MEALQDLAAHVFAYSNGVLFQGLRDAYYEFQALAYEGLDPFSPHGQATVNQDPVRRERLEKARLVYALITTTTGSRNMLRARIRAILDRPAVDTPFRLPAQLPQLGAALSRSSSNASTHTVWQMEGHSIETNGK